MIVCPRCSKENQDHYKFCLGCGAELPRDAKPAPKSFTAPTPPSGIPSADAGAAAAGRSPGGGPPSAGGFGPPMGSGASAMQYATTGPIPGPVDFGAPIAPPVIAPAQVPAPVASPAAQPPAARMSAFGPSGTAQPPAPVAAPFASTGNGMGTVTCERCAAVNPITFKFCGGCGFNLQEQVSTSIDANAAARASATNRPGAGTTRGSLVLIRPDGTEGDSYPLQSSQTLVGRSAGGVFGSDAYLSPRHATFTFDGDELRVRDESSLNGVYFKIDRDSPIELHAGSVFRVGQEIIRFDALEPVGAPEGVERMGSDALDAIGRVSLVIGRQATGNSYCVPRAGLHLGRERGDVIFPEDGYVSGLHARVHGEGGKAWLTDVGSSNGTFVRVEGEHTIRSGGLLLMGQQLFRVEF